jgi:hypothetical protein
MNNPHVTPMIKRFAFATAILFVVAIIMVTSTFNRVILTAAAAKYEQLCAECILPNRVDREREK